jgi:hypothetical protein
MDNPPSPNITSFVIRFVYADRDSQSALSGERKLPYRGAIRHIQSDEEIAFTRWEDAVDFIQRFVPLGREK